MKFVLQEEGALFIAWDPEAVQVFNKTLQGGFVKSFFLRGVFKCSPDRLAAGEASDAVMHQVPDGIGDLADKVFDKYFFSYHFFPPFSVWA